MIWSHEYPRMLLPANGYTHEATAKWTTWYCDLWQAEHHTMFEHTVVKDRFVLYDDCAKVGGSKPPVPTSFVRKLESLYGPAIGRGTRVIVRDNRSSDALYLISLPERHFRPIVAATSEEAFIRIGGMIALHA